MDIAAIGSLVIGALCVLVVVLLVIQSGRWK